jgi:hypothetical protein
VRILGHVDDEETINVGHGAWAARQLLAPDLKGIL